MVKKNVTNIMRCVRRKKDTIDFQLYNEGLDKLQKEFEIKKIIKKLRLIKISSQIILQKYQRKLIPYFECNTLYESARGPLSTYLKNSSKLSSTSSSDNSEN